MLDSCQACSPEKKKSYLNTVKHLLLHSLTRWGCGKGKHWFFPTRRREISVMSPSCYDLGWTKKLTLIEVYTSPTLWKFVMEFMLSHQHDQSLSRCVIIHILRWGEEKTKKSQGKYEAMKLGDFHRFYTFFLNNSLSRCISSLKITSWKIQSG